jgi:hypothetical protein
VVDEVDGPVPAEKDPEGEQNDPEGGPGVRQADQGHGRGQDGQESVLLFESQSGLHFLAAAIKKGVARFFLAQTYQNGKIIPNGHKLYQMAVKYSKRSLNIQTFFIPRPSKIYPNWDFYLKTNHLATLAFRRNMILGCDQSWD